jgi:excisionase family DNA binding protein
MENIVLISISKVEMEQIIENSLRNVLSELKFNNSQADSEQLLTLKDAASFLKLSPPTIYGYISSRKIPFFKMGKRVYFKKNVLLEWINEGRRKTISEIEKEATTYINKKKS